MDKQMMKMIRVDDCIMLHEDVTHLQEEKQATP